MPFLIARTVDFSGGIIDRRVGWLRRRKMLHVLCMCVKLKYALPLAQMGLAAALARCHHVWEIATRYDDMPGPSPALRLLHSIDWPVLLVPGYRIMPFPWSGVTVVAVTGLLWYWVALTLNEFRQRRQVLMFTRVPLRIAGDLFLIVSGVFLGLYCAVTVSQGPLFDMPHIGSKWLWFLPTVAFQFTWFIALISLFGRDIAQIPEFRDFMSF